MGKKRGVMEWVNSVLANAHFLDCIGCEVGCGLETIHQPVTWFDKERGLDSKYIAEGWVMARKEQGGCAALGEDGCVLEPQVRPTACLVCPLGVSPSGQVVVHILCPSALRIARGVLEKEANVMAYVAASVLLMEEDKCFVERSKRMVEDYDVVLAIGHYDYWLDIGKKMFQADSENQ